LALLEREGVFGVGMKTWDSASAEDKYHQTIVGPDPRLPSDGEYDFRLALDRNYDFLRLFPSEEWIKKALESSFKIVSTRKLKVKGYERRDEAEEFVEAICQPLPLTDSKS
jgi:hypothetical protein